MSAIYALFPDADVAQTAVNQLRAAGVAPREIVVISSEPFEDHEFSRGDKPTWMFWIAGGGGAIGLLFAYWLTRFTELDWPLPTGGMPIVANWPNLVIIFELTMLFAVLCTVVTLCITAQIPKRRPRLYDPAVSEGYILVGVNNPQVPQDRLEQALAFGGAQIKKVS